MESLGTCGSTVAVDRRRLVTRLLVALLFAGGLAFHAICPLLHSDGGHHADLAVHGTDHSHGGSHEIQCAPDEATTLAEHPASPDLPAFVLRIDPPVFAPEFRRFIPASLEGGSPPPAPRLTIPLRV